MSSSKALSALVKAGKTNSVQAIEKNLANNLNARSTRLAPNGAKLRDGAIQRQSVQPSMTKLAWTVNTDKVGVT